MKEDVTISQQRGRTKLLQMQKAVDSGIKR